MIKVGVIGASGYAGIELIRLLLSHKDIKLTKISSVSFEGKRISEIYPSFFGIFDDVFCNTQQVIENCDVIFASVPHGVSQPIAKMCNDNNKYLIDLGADFRLESEDEYKKWYGGSFIDKELHDKSVYGLCELNRDKIKNTKIVANPGCYPTSVALGLYPLLKNNLINTDNIIIDAKSGATGAGRNLSQSSHYVEINEGFHPYKACMHRHTPEIEQTLSNIANKQVKVTFVPHLLPINRGIVSTMYAQKCDVSIEQIHKIYKEFYYNETFVKVLELGKYADLKNVRMSNNCHISLHKDKHTNTLIVVSAIDNMVKGAAGQAIQNMNIMLGLEETTALMMPTPAI